LTGLDKKQQNFRFEDDSKKEEQNDFFQKKVEKKDETNKDSQLRLNHGFGKFEMQLSNY